MKKPFLVFLSLLLVGCTSVNSNTNSAGEKPSATKITAQEAKKRLDSEKDIIILDVRTEEEYKEGHIENAILLPLDDLIEDAETVLPDKEATYFIYCRSGRRSAIAAQQMIELGYKNIYDFGGILDWPYEIVQD